MILRNNSDNQFFKIQRHPPSISQVSLKNDSSCLTVIVDVVFSTHPQSKQRERTETQGQSLL